MNKNLRHDIFRFHSVARYSLLVNSLTSSAILLVIFNANCEYHSCAVHLKASLVQNIYYFLAYLCLLTMTYRPVAFSTILKLRDT